MGVRELGNGLGNPIALPIARGGGKQSGDIGSRVGDVVLMESPPDGTWEVATGQRVKMQDYPELYDEFGGVFPVLNQGDIQADLTNLTLSPIPSDKFSFVLVGDTVGTPALDLVVYTGTVQDSSGFSIKLEVVRINGDAPEKYNATIRASTTEGYSSSYYTPGLNFMMPLPDGSIYAYFSFVWGGVGGNSPRGYVIKRNASGRFASIDEVYIHSGSGGYSPGASHWYPLIYPYIGVPSWRVPSNAKSGSGTLLITKSGSSYTASDYIEPLTSPLSSVSGGSSVSYPVRPIISFNENGQYMLFGANYSTGSQYYSQGVYYVSGTSRSLVKVYEEDGVTEVVPEQNNSTNSTLFSAGVKWFNRSGDALYIHKGNAIRVYKQTSQLRFDYERQFSIQGSLASVTSTGFLLTINGTIARIYDLHTGALVVDSLTFDYQYSSISKLVAYPSMAYSVCFGILKANPKFPDKRFLVVPNIMNDYDAVFNVPNLTPIANSFNSTYTQASRKRTTYMKMKP